MRSSPPSQAMISAGAAYVRPWLGGDLAAASAVAGQVWSAMEKARRPTRVVPPEVKEAIRADLAAGVTGYAVRMKYKVGGSTVARLTKETDNG